MSVLNKIGINSMDTPDDIFDRINMVFVEKCTQIHRRENGQISGIFTVLVSPSTSTAEANQLAVFCDCRQASQRSLRGENLW
jgi:hypothetical protein